jgi:hypothetical protein
MNSISKQSALREIILNASHQSINVLWAKSLVGKNDLSDVYCHLNHLLFGTPINLLSTGFFKWLSRRRMPASTETAAAK